MSDLIDLDRSEDLFNPTFSYNPYPFANVSKELSFMDLSAYISTFNTRKFPTKIVVTHPPYINAVHKILAHTPDHVLSAYFVTRFGLTYSTLLGPQTPVRLATRRLQELLQGIKRGTPEDRQLFCQAYVDSQTGLGFIGGKEFVDRKFAGDSKEKAEKVIYDIIDAFKSRLPSVPWMDKESAKAAQGKVGAGSCSPHSELICSLCAPGRDHACQGRLPHFS
jgi:endothelin-converting enzyme